MDSTIKLEPSFDLDVVSLLSCCVKQYLLRHHGPAELFEIPPRAPSAFRSLAAALSSPAVAPCLSLRPHALPSQVLEHLVDSIEVGKCLRGVTYGFLGLLCIVDKNNNSHGSKR